MASLWVEYTHFDGGLLLWCDCPIHADCSNLRSKSCGSRALHIYTARIFWSEHAVLNFLQRNKKAVRLLLYKSSFMGLLLLLVYNQGGRGSSPISSKRLERGEKELGSTFHRATGKSFRGDDEKAGCDAAEEHQEERAVTTRKLMVFFMMQWLFVLSWNMGPLRFPCEESRIYTKHALLSNING
mmetsp:Transcript_26779/g.56073  ORF Transcript_26779/g.56073 Transcript_26779/m.56073 type:complete len:184 (+) Transcript_26779:265-816(+)